MAASLAQLRNLARRCVLSSRERVAPFKRFLLQQANRHMSDAFRVPSHLTTEERIALNRLAQGKLVVCEIGSYIGASACCFGAALIKGSSGKILCIDTWNNDAMTEGSRDTFAEFKVNTAAYAALIVPVRGYSTEVVSAVEAQAGHIDLLFIDGDHAYEGVRADWEAYKHLLRAGAVVVFHDCGWAEGVRRVIHEDVMPDVSNVKSLPNMWWGTIRNRDA